IDESADAHPPRRAGLRAGPRRFPRGLPGGRGRGGAGAAGSPQRPGRVESSGGGGFQAGAVDQGPAGERRRA
ncbi:unnamed protein product, partial [Prorocentrum cordatum]